MQLEIGQFGQQQKLSFFTAKLPIKLVSERDPIETLLWIGWRCRFVGHPFMFFFVNEK